MKRLKINFAMVAMLLGITAVFAFKAPESKKAKDSDVWYVFDSTKGADTNPNAYTKIPGTPSCTTGSELCAILGPDSGGVHPSQPTVDSPDGERDKN